MTHAEARKLDADIATLMATTMKLNAETEKLIAETGKMRMARIAGPMAATAAFTLAMVAVVKMFL